MVAPRILETVAVLPDKANNGLTWHWPDGGNLGTVVAKVNTNGLSVRNIPVYVGPSKNTYVPAEELDKIAAQAIDAWNGMRRGEDITKRATHHLNIAEYGNHWLEPVKAPTTPAGVLEGQQELFS